jgi:hypothetical protein
LTKINIGHSHFKIRPLTVKTGQYQAAFKNNRTYFAGSAGMALSHKSKTRNNRPA